MSARPSLPRSLTPTSTCSLTSLESHVRDTFKLQLYNPDDPRSPQSEEELRQRILNLLAEAQQKLAPEQNSDHSASSSSAGPSLSDVVALQTRTPLDLSALASYPPAPPPPLTVATPAISCSDDDDSDGEEEDQECSEAEEESDEDGSDFEDDDGIAPAPFDLKTIDLGREEVRERRKWERFQERMQQDRQAAELRQVLRPPVERTPEQMLQELRRHVEAARELQAREQQLREQHQAQLELRAQLSADNVTTHSRLAELPISALGCSEGELIRETQDRAAEIVQNIPKVEAAQGSLEAEIIEAAFWIRMKRLARLSEAESQRSMRPSAGSVSCSRAVEPAPNDGEGAEDEDVRTPHLASERTQRQRYLQFLETIPMPEASDEDDDAPIDPVQLNQQFRSLFPAMCAAASSASPGISDSDEEEFEGEDGSADPEDDESVDGHDEDGECNYDKQEEEDTDG